MSYRYFLAVLAICTLATSMSAQEFSFGFRAGLNFSKFVGPAQTDSEGMVLDAYDFTSGFHIGGSSDVISCKLYAV